MSRFKQLQTAALQAKPSIGKPDYATIRRQVMTRYRKTLAYLAK